MITPSLSAERLKQLPVHPTDVWECDAFRAPAWAVDSKGKPYRPLMILWISREKARTFTSPIVPLGQPLASPALDAFREAATSRDIRYVPSRVLARGAELVATLRASLVELGIRVDEQATLDYLDAYEVNAAQVVAGKASTSSYLEGAGVTLERVRAFAEAVSIFCKAQPWLEIGEYDLCRIASEVPEPGLAYCRLSQASDRLGISFFESVEHEQLFAQTTDPSRALRDHAFWTLSLRPITAMPFPDADLWLANDLPLFSQDTYPIMMRFERGQKFRRPTAAELVFTEGLLRALSASQGHEFDKGDWSRRVATFEGETTVHLQLPALLEPKRTESPRTPVTMYYLGSRAFEYLLRDLAAGLPEGDRRNPEKLHAAANQNPRAEVPRRPAQSPRERAEDLVEEAFRFGNRRRITLAREALRIDPDCVDAHLVLAERVQDPAKRFELFQEAVNAGTRALGHAFLEEHAGSLWDELDARPYLRARMNLARSLAALERRAGARAHWREILRLDPGDHLSARYDLMVSLIEENLDEEAEQLEVPRQHPVTTLMLYGRALVGFRQRGDTGENTDRLDLAVRRNPYVMKFLAGRKTVAPSHEIQDLEPGSEDEALVCAAMLHGPWERTPRALEWLETFRRQRKKKEVGRAGRSKRAHKRR
jgi:tetratricopeptide (TPR) repeat protein